MSGEWARSQATATLLRVREDGTVERITLLNKNTFAAHRQASTPGLRWGGRVVGAGSVEECKRALEETTE